jgi:hypothetical protein
VSKFDLKSDIQTSEQPGGQYDILKAAYEVDKTLTNKENSCVNKINEISKLIGLSSRVSKFDLKSDIQTSDP